MNEKQAREEICRVGRSLFDRGYVHATAGNISVKLAAEEGGGFLITPTDACLGFLEPARLAKLDDGGRQVSGDRASKTIALHMKIYASARAFDPATSCVIHTHSTHLVALSLRAPAGELLPPITPYFVMKVGHVPHIPYHRPGDPAAAEIVAETIRRYGAGGRPIRSVMLERLGPNVWHDTPAAAMATLEELEETARLVCLSPPLTPLGEGQIDELRKSFGARW
ncbi:MAG: aldolase [Alphaproteobacteria bacterium]|nr:aldolase [Alphaproteobacteria bacterium]